MDETVPASEKSTSSSERSKIITEDKGEYGIFKNKEFVALTNFILRVDGIVEENNEVTGFMISAKPKNNRDENSKLGWLESVYFTRRDMCDQFAILNKLGSSKLWISATYKDCFLPTFLKSICDKYEKGNDYKILIPVKVFGLQVASIPPTWAFNQSMQVTLVDGRVERLQNSRYTTLHGKPTPTYTYTGELDNGDSLRELIFEMESFFEDDIAAALLVIGGTGMAFHFETLAKIIKGVPPTLAVGHPISGKSTAVAAAMSLLDQRDSIGAGSEAKLSDTLSRTRIPMWWDDIDNLKVLEKLTVSAYNRSKKVYLEKEVTAITIPVISINYTKVLNGFKKKQKKTAWRTLGGCLQGQYQSRSRKNKQRRQ